MFDDIAFFYLAGTIMAKKEVLFSKNGKAQARLAVPRREKVRESNEPQNGKIILEEQANQKEQEAEKLDSKAAQLRRNKYAE